MRSRGGRTGRESPDSKRVACHTSCPYKTPGSVVEGGEVVVEGGGMVVE